MDKISYQCLNTLTGEVSNALLVQYRCLLLLHCTLRKAQHDGSLAPVGSFFAPCDCMDNTHSTLIYTGPEEHFWVPLNIFLPVREILVTREYLGCLRSVLRGVLCLTMRGSVSSCVMLIEKMDKN